LIIETTVPKYRLCLRFERKFCEVKLAIKHIKNYIKYLKTFMSASEIEAGGIDKS